MTSWTPSLATRSKLERLLWAGGPAVLGSALVLSGAPLTITLGLIASLAVVVFVALSVREPYLFLAAFLFSLEILPPLFFPSWGTTPVYLPLLLLPVAALIILFRLPDIRFPRDPLAIGFAAFLGGTAVSVPFAFWLSATRVGVESLFRWLLLGLMALTYFLIRWTASYSQGPIEQWTFRILLAGAALSAGFGILDFVWPLPWQHPAADQFIWVDTAILRRAQGVFFESSNFANFCGFFLTVTAAGFLGKKERLLAVPRWLLILLIPIFGLAVLVAFSRSTWAAVAVALLVFVCLSGHGKQRRTLGLVIAAGVPLLLLWNYSPELWNYFLKARVGYLSGILVDPNFATSGRFDTWLRVLSILHDNPQYVFFGVGYKALGFTQLFHGEIITDNGYLNLLLETGMAGLLGFLVFSAAILRTFLRLARADDEELAHWSKVMFAVWCGELVQLLAVDGYTFWRNMIVMAAVMALTLNRAERLERSR